MTSNRITHTGPFETERQAAETVRHITDSPPGTGAWGDGNRRLIETACLGAGVELGDFDQRIIGWLAGYEPWTCAVVAGIITRAARPPLSPEDTATVLAALEDAPSLIRAEAADCAECSAAPAALCDGHESALERAESYDQLAARLRDGAR